MIYKLQCDHPNVNENNLVYHVFGHLEGKSATRVKGDLEGYILDQYNTVSQMIMEFVKPLKLDTYSYISRIAEDGVRPDIMCIYLLAKMFARHVAVVTEDRVWYTFEGEGSMDVCDLVLVYRGGNRFVNTQPMQVRPISQAVFEAGDKVPVPDEKDDPDYVPKSGKVPCSTRKSDRGKHKPPLRRTAKAARRRVRSSYYHDPDYVVEVQDSESESSQAEVLLEEVPAVKKRRKNQSNKKQTTEKVIGTIKIIGGSSSSTEEYDVSQYPGIVTKKSAKELAQKKSLTTGQSETRKESKKTVPGKTFALKKQVKKAVKCLRCRALFNSHREMNAHVLQEHGLTFKCSKCDKVFKARRYLVAHVKRHNTKKLPLHCDKCGKGFLYPYELKEHSAVHSNEGTFKCNWQGCKRRFKFKQDLREHFLSDHTTTPQLKCPHCVQTFADRRHLNQHIRTHSEPAIPCPQCGRLFRHYSTRNKHLKSCRPDLIE